MFHELEISRFRCFEKFSIRDLTRAVLRDREEEVQYMREYLYQVPAQSPARHAAA